jgi:beta-N-acetylhexosaminidase
MVGDRVINNHQAASKGQVRLPATIFRVGNYQGVIITDDLVMGATYNHNVCTAVVEALNASVDLLLVAFDGSQFYRIFGCASGAFSRGDLDTAVLHDSDARLKHARPAE